MRNERGQFFVAGVIIMIFTITIIFHFSTNVRGLDHVRVHTRGETLMLSAIEVETGHTLENLLGNISRENLGDEQAVVDSNLSRMTGLFQNISLQRGFDLNLSVRSGSADRSVSHIEAHLNYTLITPGGIWNGNHTIRREIMASITSVESMTPDCNFTVEVLKEYSEPVRGLTQAANIEAVRLNEVIGSTACTVDAFSETSTPGRYIVACEGQVCSDDGTPPVARDGSIRINLTDNRNAHNSSFVDNGA